MGRRNQTAGCALVLAIAVVGVIAAGCGRPAATSESAPPPAAASTPAPLPTAAATVPATLPPATAVVPPTPPPPSPTPRSLPATRTPSTPLPTPTAAPTAKPEFVASAGAVPLSVSIPRLHTAADIVPLGMQPDGETMDVPSDPDTIGWYHFTAQVGRPGNAVLVGHVDWGGRLRAFGRLRDLRPGDEVDVVDALGRQLAYSVQSTEVVDADSSPAEFLTQLGPDQELTLITCGGTFDHAAHQYLSRVIVRAVRDSTDQ